MFQATKGHCFLGETLVLSNGFIEAEVTTDVGPRIISLKKRGCENIMFQDELDEVNRDCSSVFGAGAMWHIYGGHRIWLSPEGDETYYPDNGKVEVNMLPNGAEFTTAPIPVINVRFTLKIEFTAENELRIGNIVQNLSPAPRLLCVWALTVLKTGGEVCIPFNTRDTGLLANRNLVFWPYTNITDERITITNEDLTLKGVRGADSNIKIGLYSEKFIGAYKRGDTTLVKKLRPAAPPECYPDYCCNIETFTSHLIHEVETLSPRTSVPPQGLLEHVEFWELI